MSQIKSLALESYAGQPIYGQWIGGFSGQSPGFATLNIEKDRLGRAFACIFQGTEIPGSRIDFATEIKGNVFKATSTSIRAFDNNKQRLIPASEWLKQFGKGVIFSKEIVVEGKLDGAILKGHWHGDAGFDGQVDLTNPAAQVPIAADHTFSWAGFKGFISDVITKDAKYIFRGEPSNAYRLKTSFHRKGRYDLIRYNAEVTEALVQHINASSAHKYNVQDGSEFGALLSLAQHHGFPTPLLDWTHSPYIAAFFALEEIPNGNPAPTHARVYVLDAEKWRSTTGQTAHLEDPSPVVTLREFPAHNNPRHLPQQSIHSFANVEDVAAWIRLIEGGIKNKYLTVIDIPRSERRVAMRDLAYMGLTAATLFPGLDGVCRALKDRYFDFD